MYALACVRVVLREAETRRLKTIELGVLQTDAALANAAVRDNAVIEAEHAIESLAAFNNQGRCP
jgi:hypothetical protein